MFLMASIVYCIVGCNTGAPDRQSLHVLECDTETGVAKIVQTVKDIQGTTYFQIDRERKNLYTAISENGKGAIVKFALEGHRIGAMTKIVDLPCEAPCHVSLSPDEKRVAFAAYVSATCGTVGIDGRGLVTYTFPDDAMGCRKDRQQKAYAHQTFFTQPDGVGPAMMGVVDLGCDRIRFFDVGKLESCKVEKLDGCKVEKLDGWKVGDLESCLVGELKSDPGDGPRHAIFSGAGKVLYVVNELSSTVASYCYNPSTLQPSILPTSQPSNPPTFRRVSKLSMLPSDCTLKPTETKAAAIKLTADGKILMASNRGHDSIAFYDAAADGKLTLKNVAKLTGKFPRDFELMPGEKFMVAGHKMSNEIQIYSFDREKCTLVPVGKPIECWRPLCFKFI